MAFATVSKLSTGQLKYLSMATSLEKKSTITLLKQYAELMAILRERKVLRTGNNPVADYAEYVVAKRLKLRLASPSQKSFDAISMKGKKYQIKCRRVTTHSSSLQLGVIRNLKDSQFHFLIAVVFNEDFSVRRMYQIPRSAIRKYGRFSKHQNGHILSLSGPIQKDKDFKVIK